MASLVKPFIDNLKSISDKLPMLAREAIEKNAPEIVMLVKSKQLGRGRNSRGEPLVWASGNGFYALATQSIFDGENESSMRGQQVQKAYKTPYNFSWTGQTLDLMSLRHLSGSSFEIFTADSKMKMLEDIYGEIFSLTEEHNAYVNEEIILPYLYEYLLANLFNV